jgi:hypothetical protein
MSFMCFMVDKRFYKRALTTHDDPREEPCAFENRAGEGKGFFFDKCEG